MKKLAKVCVTILMMVLLLTGCGKKEQDKNWYLGTLNYYTEGFQTGWKNETSDFNISDEMKDKNNKFGYLLKDLDGDGIDEFLVGIIDDSAETKFTDIVILHRDFGPFRSFSTGEGYYMYLCDDNVIRMDSWYGSQTETRYMEYNSEENSFPIVDGGSKPQKCELTPFE